MARTKATPQEAQERAQEKVQEALALPGERIGSILDGEGFAHWLVASELGRRECTGETRGSETLPGRR